MTVAHQPSPDLMLEDWDEDEQNVDETQLVTFKVGDEEYGLPIMQVQEILRMSPISHLAGAPDYVQGMMGLRGHVLLVMDLRKRLRLPPKERVAKNRIVVLNVSGQTMGLTVDAITSVLRLPTASIRPAEQISEVLRSSYVAGIASIEKRLIIVLRAESLMEQGDLQPLDPSAYEGMSK